MCGGTSNGRRGGVLTMAFPTDEEVAAALLAGRHSAMSVRTAVAAHAAALQATVADLGGVLRHLQRAKREREWVRADQEAREAAAVEAAEVEAARAAPMTRELEAALSRARQVRADMESAGMVLDDDGDQPAAQVVARRGSRDPDTRTRTRTHTRTRTDRSSSRRGTQQRVGSRQQRGRGRGQDRYRGRDGRLGSGRGRGRGRGRGSIPQRVATGARTAHDESGAARGGSVRPRHPVAASPPHPHPHPHPDGRNSARPSPGPSPPPRSHASDRTPPPSARSTQASPRKLRVRTRLPARFRRLCLEWRQHVEDGAAAAVPPPSSSSPSPYAEVAAAAAGRAHTTRAASHAPTLLAARRRHVTAVERLFAHQSHLVEAPPPPPRTRTHHPDRRPGADSGAAAAAAAADGAASASRAPAMLVSLIRETQRLRREVQALSGAHAPPVPVQRWADVRAEAQALWDEAKEAPEAGGAKRTAGNKLLDVVYPHWRRMSEVCVCLSECVECVWLWVPAIVVLFELCSCIHLLLLNRVFAPDRAEAKATGGPPLRSPGSSCSVQSGWNWRRIGSHRTCRNVGGRDGHATPRHTWDRRVFVTTPRHRQVAPACLT